MSRSTSLSLIFEAEFSQARAKWNAFVQEVEGRPVRINFEGTPPSTSGPAAGARSFSGGTAVPPGGTFVPAPTASPQVVASGAPNLGPIQQAQADEYLRQIQNAQGQMGGASPEGQKLLSATVRNLQYKYFREFETLPPGLQASGQPVMSDLSAMRRASTYWGMESGIGSGDFERSGAAPGIEGLNISGRTRRGMYSAAGGGERPLALTEQGETEFAAHQAKYKSPRDKELDNAMGELEKSIRLEAGEHARAAAKHAARSSQVDRAFDQAALAQQRAAEQTARRVDTAWDSAAFSQFRQDERTATQAAEAAEDPNTMGAQGLTAIQQEAADLHTLSAYGIGGGGAGGAAAGAGGYGGGFVGARPPQDSDAAMGGRAFGFIRPLAAAFLFAHGTGALVNRFLQEDARSRAASLSGSYDTLGQQTQRALAGVEQEEGHLNLWIGQGLNDAAKGGGPSGFIARALGGGRYTDRNTLSEAREAARDQEAADAGYSALRESRTIRAESKAFGLQGYAAELAQGVESDRQILEALTIEERRFPGMKGFGEKRQAVVDRANQRLRIMGTQVNMQTAGMSMTALAITQASMGQEWASSRTELQGKQDQETFAMTMATVGLPQWMQSQLMNSLAGSHKAEGEALTRENIRKVEMSISKADWQIQISQDTRRGYSHEAMVAQSKAPFYDQQGYVIDDQGRRLDPSNPQFPQMWQSRVNQANEARATGERGWQQGQISGWGEVGATWQQSGRDPFGAQLRRIQTQFDATTYGMDPKSVDYQLAEAQRDSQTAAAKREHDDALEVLSAGLSSESRGLKKGLARDYAGQQLEELTGGYEQRQLQLRDVDQKDQRLQTIKNEASAIELFQQRYQDAFRGQALDTRLFSLDNPRDAEDPGKVLTAIEDKLGQTLRLLQDLTNEDS